MDSLILRPTAHKCSHQVPVVQGRSLADAVDIHLDGGWATTSVAVTGLVWARPMQGSWGSIGHPGNGDRWWGGSHRNMQWAVERDVPRLVNLEAVLHVAASSGADGMSAAMQSSNAQCASRPTIACSCMVWTLPSLTIGHTIGWDSPMDHP